MLEAVVKKYVTSSFCRSCSLYRNPSAWWPKSQQLLVKFPHAQFKASGVFWHCGLYDICNVITPWQHTGMLELLKSLRNNTVATDNCSSMWQEEVRSITQKVFNSFVSNLRLGFEVLSSPQTVWLSPSCITNLINIPASCMHWCYTMCHSCSKMIFLTLSALHETKDP